MMNWLQQLAGGGQQQQPSMDNPFAAQQAYDNAQQDRQRALQMQQAQYQGGGASGILAGLLSMLGGKQLERRADETASQALQRQFQYQNEAAAAAQEKAMADEDAKYKRLMARDAARIEAEAKAKAANAQKEFKNGFWVDPRTGAVEAVPQYLAAQEKLRAAGRTNVTVNGDGTPPTGFEKALDKKDAEFYDNLRQQAQTATGTLENLAIIKKVLEGAQTGKTQELLAQAGQYFGTNLGTDMQTFNVAARPLFLAMAESMKGALSDKDREILQQASPSFGIDPQANAVVIGILERAAKRSQTNYQEADAYAQKNRGLRGFQPSIAPGQMPPMGGGAGGAGTMSGAPPEGTRVQGPDGRIYVVRNGMPVPEG